MSAILSADDLNDFISPGVACIKPVETLPKQAPEEINAYEVTTEDKIQKETAPPAEISLTDCLACSGCVTSAEAVLVSLQSHAEVLNTLDSHPSIDLSDIQGGIGSNGKLFVASVSPQVRASLAATYAVSAAEAGWMIDQLLAGEQGLRTGGQHGNGFSWVVDTNAMREASLVLGAEEVMESLSGTDAQMTSNDDGAATKQPKKPILSSACPGWICYAEKTHPHVLPHLSRLKSPQALTGTLLKTVLSQRLNIRPDQIWHVSIMPCFDKKLEASREELTDIQWRPSSSEIPTIAPVRDVDCVITARELLMLAETRGISFPTLARQPLTSPAPFPCPLLSAFLFPPLSNPRTNQPPDAGTSGGYLHHILATQLSLHPTSTLQTTRGRNADVVEYSITTASSLNKPIFKAARYYGFRNIQNLVRKLKPVKKSRLPGAKNAGARAPGGVGMDYAYVEVMACPGGCTNGGGQIKVDDVPLKPETAMTHKQWLERVDEAYYSMSESEDEDMVRDGVTDVDGAMHQQQRPADLINGISPSYIKGVLEYWSSTTGVELRKLVTTSYRKVESDVGRVGGAENERVVELAGRIGGGW